MSEQLINVYDAQGNPMQITKETWRVKVLPGIIKQAWDNPDKLYDAIYCGFKDEFFQDVEKAAERLLKIDQNIERGYTMLGIVFMKTDRKKKARKLFEKYIKKYKPSGTILTNYAKTFDDNGEQQLEILEKALHIDPNQDNSVRWWAAVHLEKDGEESYKESLEKIASVQGSWFPQLLLGILALKNNELKEALDNFKYVLSISSDARAIQEISGELGKRGFLKEAIELIEPIYSADKHGLPSGFNLLQLYVETNQPEKGEALLKSLYKMNLIPWKQRLDHYTIEFEKLQSNSL
ncbi:MAG: repeat-containing protein [Rickettsiaceae bacterium]|jgi:tetratricopeptide (TPR) repeat protein|nr:repeat-containing protein [Rickettsiaceae bacterium]